MTPIIKFRSISSTLFTIDEPHLILAFSTVYKENPTDLFFPNGLNEASAFLPDQQVLDVEYNLINFFQNCPLFPLVTTLKPSTKYVLCCSNDTKTERDAKLLAMTDSIPYCLNDTDQNIIAGLFYITYPEKN